MIDRFELFTSYISEIYRHIQKIERDVMESYGLKGPHVQCLVAMSRVEHSVTTTQLAALCEKDKAAISRTLSEMVQEGLVVREGQGSYRAALQLTEKESLKPDLLVNTLAKLAGVEAPEMRIHRKMIYGENEGGELRPLMEL